MEFKLTENSGIYAIKNLINDKMYIGSSKQFSERFRSHLCLLNNNNHFNTHLQSSYLKYGENNFNFLCIEEIKLEDFESEEDFAITLIAKEEYYIQYYNTNNNQLGYNARVNCNTNLGLKWSDESKKKFSESKKGKPLPENAQIKLKEYLKSIKGKPNEKSKEYFRNLEGEERDKIFKKLNENLDKARETKQILKETTGSSFTKAGILSFKEKKGIKVYCYLLTGKLYKEFLTFSDALKFLNENPKNTQALKNMVGKKIYKNFYFDYNKVDAFSSDFMKEIIDFSNNNSATKKVAEYDLKMNILNTYETISEIALKLGFSKSTPLREYILKNKPYKNHYYKYIEPINSDVIRKQDELLGSLEADNQQPNLSSNTFKGSTTNTRILTDNTEDSNGDTSFLPLTNG